MRIIRDRLPKPSELAFKEDQVKVTIALSMTYCPKQGIRAARAHDTVEWADKYRQMVRSAIEEGAEEADRGELIPGDDVFAQIDAMIAEMRNAAAEE